MRDMTVWGLLSFFTISFQAAAAPVTFTFERTDVQTDLTELDAAAFEGMTNQFVQLTYDPSVVNVSLVVDTPICQTEGGPFCTLTLEEALAGVDFGDHDFDIGGNSNVLVGGGITLIPGGATVSGSSIPVTGPFDSSNSLFDSYTADGSTQFSVSNGTDQIITLPEDLASVFTSPESATVTAVFNYTFMKTTPICQVEGGPFCQIDSGTVTFSYDKVSPVPLPGSALLFGSGLFMFALRRRS